MKRLLLMTAASFAVTATSTFAGGIERSTQSVGILFEEGTYGEFSFSTVSPSVSGVFPGGSTPSGDMAASYQNYSFGYKQDIGDNLSFALVLDQPIGANVAYPSAGAYPFAGSTATVDSHAVNGFLRYKFPSNFSVYGGLRAQSVTADLNVVTQGIPAPAYNLHVGTDIAYGYALGVAYEKPEIALRVALTYNSEITHSLPDNTGTSFDVEIPKSWNLEFQSGVAENTLVFGSIRWVEWKSFKIAPLDYLGGAVPLASGTINTTAYTLGVGRKFNDKWSGAVVLGYEGGGGVPVGNLGPTDGYRSIGLAATYKVNNVKITGGVRYIDIGDAVTSITSNFSGNDAIGVGVKVGFSF